MDDKVSSTNAILLMIIIAPRHAPKDGASVVVGAGFAPRHGFPMSSLPEFADLETLLCQGNFSADAARTDGQGANCTFSGRQPAGLCPLRSVPQQSSPTRRSFKRGRRRIIFGDRKSAGGLHKCFTFSSRWLPLN